MLLDELVAEVAEVRDKVDEGELQKELEKLVIERSGSPLLEDTGTREATELELRADGYGAARGDDDGPQVYSLPLNELRRRVADGEDAWPGEAQMAWDQRVMRDRLTRGVPLGDYLQELQQLLQLLEVVAERHAACKPIAHHALIPRHLRLARPRVLAVGHAPPQLVQRQAVDLRPVVVAARRAVAVCAQLELGGLACARVLEQRRAATLNHQLL